MRLIAGDSTSINYVNHPKITPKVLTGKKTTINRSTVVSSCSAEHSIHQKKNCELFTCLGSKATTGPHSNCNNCCQLCNFLQNFGLSLLLLLLPCQLLRTSTLKVPVSKRKDNCHWTAPKVRCIFSQDHPEAACCKI
jgi:hypothetical protein